MCVDRYEQAKLDHWGHTMGGGGADLISGEQMESLGPHYKGEGEEVKSWFVLIDKQ